MNFRCRKLVLITSVLLLAVSTNARSPNEVGDIIDGATEPGRIPYQKKLRAFFILYDPVHRKELAPSLSNADIAVIEGMSGSQAFNLENEAELYRNDFLGLCARMDSMDAESLAIEYKRQADEKKAAEAARYREGLSGLSAEGKATLEQYLASKVTPGMKVGESDPINKAKNDPERFRLNLRVSCHVMEHGELPTESNGTED